MPEPARRGKRGPAPGTGGRPKRGDEASANLTLRVTAEERERVARLRAAWELDSDAAAVRRALEMADDMLREGGAEPL